MSVMHVLGVSPIGVSYINYRMICDWRFLIEDEALYAAVGVCTNRG
jgi:hypothetical protein